MHQLTTTNTLVLVFHPDCISTALAAARQSGVAADHILLMDELNSSGKSPIPYPSVSSLVNEGLSKPASFEERKLSPGEGKTKLAFLSFSSGTTGKPKVFIPYVMLLEQERSKINFLHRLSPYLIMLYLQTVYKWPSIIK